jgi:hypothetical protein
MNLDARNSAHRSCQARDPSAFRASREVYRENREFHPSRRFDCAKFRSNARLLRRYSDIPCASEQGKFWRKTSLLGDWSREKAGKKQGKSREKAGKGAEPPIAVTGRSGSTSPGWC